MTHGNWGPGRAAMSMLTSSLLLAACGPSAATQAAQMNLAYQAAAVQTRVEKADGCTAGDWIACLHVGNYARACQLGVCSHFDESCGASLPDGVADVNAAEKALRDAHKAMGEAELLDCSHRACAAGSPSACRDEARAFMKRGDDDGAVRLDEALCLRAGEATVETPESWLREFRDACETVSGEKRSRAKAKEEFELATKFELLAATLEVAELARADADGAKKAQEYIASEKQHAADRAAGEAAAAADALAAEQAEQDRQARRAMWLGVAQGIQDTTQAVANALPGPAPPSPPAMSGPAAPRARTASTQPAPNQCLIPGSSGPGCCDRGTGQHDGEPCNFDCNCLSWHEIQNFGLANKLSRVCIAHTCGARLGNACGDVQRSHAVPCIEGDCLPVYDVNATGTAQKPLIVGHKCKIP